MMHWAGERSWFPPVDGCFCLPTLARWFNLANLKTLALDVFYVTCYRFLQSRLHIMFHRNVMKEKSSASEGSFWTAVEGKVESPNNWYVRIMYVVCRSIAVLLYLVLERVLEQEVYERKFSPAVRCKSLQRFQASSKLWGFFAISITLCHFCSSR